MSIVLIGGHDRMHCIYSDICNKCGHRVKIFTQGDNTMEKQIGSADAMIIFTSTVSHNMVKRACKTAKKKSIPVYRSHCSSGCALENLLDGMKA